MPRFRHDAPFDREPELPWLAPQPPPWLARSVSSLLLALFVVALAGASWLQVPETVTSHFVLRPVGGADPVRTPRDGELTALRVAEGEPVEAGQELALVRSSALGDREGELRESEAELASLRASRSIEDDAWQSRGLADEEEARRLESRIDGLARQIELARRELALEDDLVGRHQRLVEAGVASASELARREIARNDARLALETLEGERSDAEARLRALRHERAAAAAAHERDEHERAETVARLEIRVASLRRSLDDTQGDTLSVRTPCRGTVLRLHVHGTGSLVRQGDVLAEISCAGAPLEALLTLPQADVALLAPGQGVKLLYDALPHERYGVRRAELRWVSPASVEQDGRPVFRALARLASDRVAFGAREVALRAGMEGRARIVVGRRSLLAHAFEPLRRLREVVSDVPSEGIDATGAGA